MIQVVGYTALPIWLTTLLATAVGGAIPILGSLLAAREKRKRQEQARRDEALLEQQRWQRDSCAKEREDLRATYALALTPVCQLINVRSRMNTVGQYTEAEEEAREYMRVLREVLPKLLVTLPSEKQTVLTSQFDVLAADFPMLVPLQGLLTFLSEAARADQRMDSSYP